MAWLVVVLAGTVVPVGLAVGPGARPLTAAVAVAPLLGAVWAMLSWRPLRRAAGLSGVWRFAGALAAAGVAVAVAVGVTGGLLLRRSPPEGLVFLSVLWVWLREVTIREGRRGA